MASIPGFATIRFPARFVIVAHLGFALLAGPGLDRVVKQLPGIATWPFAILTWIAAMVAVGTIPPLELRPEVTGSSVPPVYGWLAAHGEGRALMELPRGDPKTVAKRMYFSTYHRLPIVDGSSGYPPLTARYLYRLAQGLPDPAALQSLVDVADIGWILVHRGELSPFEAQRWMPAGLYGLDAVDSVGDDLLFRVNLPPAEDRRSTFLSTRTTRSGVPLARLDECSGTLQLIGTNEIKGQRGRRTEFEVNVTNTGQSPWPVLSFYGRHVVQLVARIVSSDGAVVRSRKVSLRGDVGAGEKVSRTVDLAAPVQIGKYTLEIELVQIGDGPLSQCGVAPLRIPLEIAGHVRGIEE